jgi:hypothetical protein
LRATLLQTKLWALSRNGLGKFAQILTFGFIDPVHKAAFRRGTSVAHREYLIEDCLVELSYL